MKRQLAMATLGLAVVSSSAFASKARLESLGQSDNGSQYIDDNRSIFLNAAHLNHHKDFVTVEVGDNATGTDNAATPQMEGGVFKASGNMVYGIYFGDEADDSNGLRRMVEGAVLGADATAGSVAVTDLGNALGNGDERNVVSFFVAGDAGIQWGAGLTYDSFKTDGDTNVEYNNGAEDYNLTDIKGSALRARLGVISGNLDVFVNLGLGNTYEADTNVAGFDKIDFQGKLSYDAGVGYDLGADAKAMLRVQHLSAEEKTTDSEVKMNNMHIGVAKSYKLNDKSNLWVSGFYKQNKRECDAVFATFCSSSDELTETFVPVTVSLEVQAKDWLTLRGYIAQDVLVSETDNGTDKSTRNSREHGIGASLNFGDLSVDGNLILAGAAGTVGTLNFDEPMSRVSLNYNF